MDSLFEWDPKKARSNLKKHGVRFADAVFVFEDPEALELDEQDADGESRHVLLGVDAFERILVVVYTHRGARFRIISARKATKNEAKEYEKRV